MPSPQLENIGLALQGLGAGLGGQLPQFLQTQNQRQGLQQQQQLDQFAMAERQQQMAIERQKTMFTDAFAANQLLESGNVDGVIQLGINRLQMLKQLSQIDPSIDPSDTQRVTQLAIAARNGDEEAMELLKGELASTVEVGRAIGVIQEPKQEEFTLSPGQARFRGSEVIAAVPENAPPLTDIGKLQSDLQKGLISVADFDAAVSQMRQGAAARPAGTDIGKINQDLQSGAINQEQYNQLIDAAIQERETAARSGEVKIEEQENKDQLMAMETQRIYDLTQRLLDNPKGLAGATGPVSSIIPSFKQETVDFEANLKELQDLLTMTNLGRMTGVLSESDIRLISNAASGLNSRASEARMNEKLNEIRARILPKLQQYGIAPETQAAASDEPITVNGFTIRRVD